MTIALRARRAAPEHAAEESGADRVCPAASESSLGVLLAGWAGVFCVAILPVAYAASWAPRVILLLPLVVPGVLALVFASRRRVRGARWGVAFLAVAGVSAALADRPVLALVGNHNRASGWLFLAAGLGLWALGLEIGERGRRLVRTALIAGVVASALVGWLQSAVDIPIAQLDAGGPRAHGLTGNAATFGALAVGGLWLVADRIASDERWARWSIVAVVVSGGVQLSGSRAALAVLAAFTFVWLVRTVRRASARRGLGLVVAVGMGVVLSMQIAAGGAATARARDSVDPTAGTGRGATWVAGIEAVGEHPLLGVGPARTKAAVMPLLGPELARTEPLDTEPDDAHNFLLEYTVTTGIIGGALFAGWLIAAGRQARGPGAGFAAGIAAVGLFQPVAMATAPLALLALGSAHSGAGDPVRNWGRVARGVGLFGVVVGLAAGAAFLRGEIALGRAYTDSSATAAATADRLLPPWSVVPSVEWRIHAFDAITERDPAAWEAAVDAARRAVERDPSSAHLWSNLADLRLRTGDRDGAQAAYAEALARHPWSPRALNANIYFADERGDTATVDRLCEQRAELGARSSCPASVRMIFEA